MEDVGLLMEKSLETTGIILAELLNFVMMPQYILVTHMLHAMTGVLECCLWVLLTLFLPGMEKMIIYDQSFKKSYKIEDKVSSHEKNHSMLQGDSITYK